MGHICLLSIQRQSFAPCGRYPLPLSLAPFLSTPLFPSSSSISCVCPLSLLSIPLKQINLPCAKNLVWELNLGDPEPILFLLYIMIHSSNHINGYEVASKIILWLWVTSTLTNNAISLVPCLVLLTWFAYCLPNNPDIHLRGLDKTLSRSVLLAWI